MSPAACTRFLHNFTRLCLVWLALLPDPAAASTNPPPSADADCVEPGAPDTEFLLKLLDWIGEATDYPVTGLRDDLPAISFCRTGQTIAYEGHDMIVDRSLNAAYDALDKRIWLVLPWSAEDTRQVSILLHELVHHVQFQSRDWPCPQASEEEAYRLQHQWLAEHGLASGFNWFVIWMRARCPREVHP